jgi:hypothetical protein
LVEPVDVYLVGSKGVQNGAEEPEDVPHVVVQAALHRVPIVNVLLHQEVLLVPVPCLGRSLLPTAAGTVDLSYGLLGNMMYRSSVHHMLYFLRHGLVLSQLVHHSGTGDTPRKIHESWPQSHVLKVLPKSFPCLKVLWDPGRDGRRNVQHLRLPRLLSDGQTDVKWGKWLRHCRWSLLVQSDAHRCN